MLAGVCAGLAGFLHWNVWGMRLAWLVLLLIKPLLAIALYVVFAAGFALLEPAARKTRARGPWLASPELADRARRIEDLDRRLDGL